MKWFDKNEIKEKETLTPEQIDYLLQPSLTICGPFNCLFRKQFDFFLTWLFLMGVGEFYFTESDDYYGIFGATCLIINSLLLAWVTYFFVKYGRRLAWNRSRWKSFETFEKSETNWLTATIISFSTLFIQLFRYMPKAMNEDLLIYAIIMPLYLGFAILLPFFQAWRSKKADRLSKQIE